MDESILSPDTQVTLLLCGSLGQPRHGEFKPLSLTEYNKLAQYLLSRQMRPNDLLNPGAIEGLNGIVDQQRLAFLIGRGGALALASEGWINKGLWVLGRSDRHYPQLLRSKLGRQAPPLLYGAGKREILSSVGWAIIGSRDADEGALDFTRRVARACTSEQLVVISGGARGIDMEAITAALECGGQAIGVLADSLVKASVSGKYRQAIRGGNLVLMSAYDPEASFSVGNAMGRNKYVYALSEAALVVSSAYNQGGTWAGAIEDLQHGWATLIVRVGERVPEGNARLVEMGGIAMSTDVLDAWQPRAWLKSQQLKFAAEPACALHPDTQTPPFQQQLLPGLGA